MRACGQCLQCHGPGVALRWWLLHLQVQCGVLLRCPQVPEGWGSLVLLFPLFRSSLFQRFQLVAALEAILGILLSGFVTVLLPLFGFRWLFVGNCHSMSWVEERAEFS